MFGMGIAEILVIAIIAIIALGPEKLPDAMVQIAKLFNSLKKSINEAKTTLDNELNINELKNEANKFKAQIEDTKLSLTNETKVDLGLDDVFNTAEKDIKKGDNKNEKSEKFSIKDSKE